MADFIAVIRRAVDGLSSNTPEMRVRVYEKARAAVVRQLENMQPRPPEHMLQRQLEKLDAAIRDVEAEHAAAEQLSAPPPVEEPAPTVTGDDWADAYMAEPEPQPAVPAYPEPVTPQAPREEFAPWQTPGGAAEPIDAGRPVAGATSFDEGRHPAEPDIEDGYPAASQPQVDTWSQPSAPVVPLWEQREAAHQQANTVTNRPPEPYDDWQAPQAAGGLPAAEWSHPDLLDPASNRVPELPEVDTTSSHATHTPMDEYPPFEEPTRVQTGMEFGATDHYPVPGDPVALGNGAPAGTGITSEPDDFSQWFQDHAGDVQQQPEAAAADADFGASAAVSAGAQPKNDAMDALMGGYDQPAYRLEPRRSRNFAPVILAVIGFTIAAGAGVAGWVYRDSFSSMFNNVAGEPVQTNGGTTETASTDGAAESDTTQEAANGGETPDAAGADKFTQRLQSDGTEVDEGAAAAPSIGTPPEGRSVSAQTLASNIEGADAAAATAAQNAASPAATATAAAGGDKLFLYEEQIGQATPVAVPGGVTWTALRENGPDGRPDPQIQGRLTVPDRGLSALLTIKRNTDDSLPASHIIEVVFSVPATFEGGAIESLQRIAMKRTEQDRGDPLVAVTAKVTDDTYLVALNDFEDVIARNLDLLSTRGWIDIPVVYRNGRRALITMDKGAEGARVFEDVIREWRALGPGN